MAFLETSTAAGRTTFRFARPAVSGVLPLRPLAVGALLTAVTFAAFCVSVADGRIQIPLTEVVPALFGHGDPGTLLVVRELRLPRALTGLLVGAAFGLSGAVFQAMTGNPLASPDMIGVIAGAQTAVVAGIVLGFGAGLGTQTLGVVGALVAALVVYLLAWGGAPPDTGSCWSVSASPGCAPAPPTTWWRGRCRTRRGRRWAGWSAASTSAAGTTYARSPWRWRCWCPPSCCSAAGWAPCTWATRSRPPWAPRSATPGSPCW
ncbi:hypothetical protein Prubr_17450 [Polymorphospora rubra]|uniref:Transport system permease protein n=1 Tax=Polymorphospora rubra TaxID=338584 RepID=A0A810MW05_9ACTN|nr:hypothetical protein Prubr_17450 [Polymorphospora rubra]